MYCGIRVWYIFFFFNDTATTEIYTLSLHDALPISPTARSRARAHIAPGTRAVRSHRSEEHTSELQSPLNLVCRLLLEKKKTHPPPPPPPHHPPPAPPTPHTPHTT